MTVTLHRPITGAPRGEPVPEPPDTKHNKLVIFAFSGDLDRVWPTFILGTTAAASGMETTIFFTFWGLFPLVRNDVAITGENWMQKMMAVATATPLPLLSSV